MALTVGVPGESAPEERLVALVPEVAGRLVKKGMTVRVEAGAGAGAYYPDAAYEAQGAQIVDREAAFAADVVLKVNPPDDAEIGLLRKGSVLIGFLRPLDRPEVAERLARQGVTALSMELVPRISRAQKMDALSALSSVGGYRAALIAATALPKFFPLLTTAAGTVRPANVLVLGAGVAGLQAIATARRLGARVSAYDIREAVREEVQSLGATFVDLPFETQEDKETGGYARALPEEKARQQTKLLVPHIAAADVVITTALIPGRPAPLLVTEEAVAAMQPGSVIVDMAAPSGGNCALTRPGDTVVEHGVQIFGPLNLPATMPVHASQLYARTLMAMLFEFADGEAFRPDFEDEIFKGACVTYDGEVVHERVRGLLTPG
ncbi:Re/Si-specific NAD(P)(+) transhydrogenase subunit alpha [Rhodocaloribacter litoris]|uniref:Re/Si-specific NAD(P)(+) transhydrogenase subunit alpha n=1 Tax=Rhodocaloribacter litoris TaxID=2558931 RepID=UPI00141F33F2|nr:Re/Si-specific NAD(P)(+) transhydrogenase subunit alpha [Rhodocaloribacter litoris]QXD14818.1 Re/Si-specific NAD(P)(+) transhydrogenase subunit alpha [Rhodocaloribacter litoris]GIV59091.1 MAG: NAD(P) transhydrogenase subunit alpha [Rhodothermaceae bacterium]